MSVMSVPLDTKMVFSIDDAPNATSPLERTFDRSADALYRFILMGDAGQARWALKSPRE